MMVYLFKSVLCMAICYGLYKAFLEREKIHVFNRFYLLFSLVFSLMIPSVTYEVEAPIIEKTVSPNFIPQTFIPPKPVVEEYTNSFDWVILLWLCYGIICLLLAIRFGANLWRIFRQVANNQQITLQNTTLVLLHDDVLPCTFLNYIFLNKTTYEQHQIEEELLRHELCHVRQKHSLDILFIEVLIVFFWFNPLLYFYKKAVQLNHEFLADDAVNQTYQNVTFYQKILLQKSIIGNIQLTSSSTFQLTKQRLIMMTKHTTRTVAIFKTVATLLLFVVLGISFSESTVAQSTTPTLKLSAPATTKTKELTKEDVNYKNGTYMVLVDDFLKGWKSPKKYSELTEEEKQMIGIPLYSEKTGSPTEKMLSDWSSSDKFGVWVDDKFTDKPKMKTYKTSDFAYYDWSKLYKNAQVGNRRYQIHLMTHSYYDNVYMKAVKEKPFFVIDKRKKK